MAARIRHDWSKGIPGWAGWTLVGGATALAVLETGIVQNRPAVAVLSAVGLLCAAGAMLGALAAATNIVLRVVKTSAVDKRER